jgi:uncharacterized membrane protein
MTERETLRRLVLGAVVTSGAIVALATAGSLALSSPLIAGAPYPLPTQIVAFALAAFTGTLAGATLLQWLSFHGPIRPVAKQRGRE